MRITKSLLFSVLFAFVLGIANANIDPNFNSARKEIKTLIVDSELFSDLEESLTIHVTFLVNAKNEIIILSTDKEDYDESLKAVLNYKKLKSADMSVNTTYTLPLTLKK